MHQRGAAAGLPSHADKCARTDEAAINSHYRRRLRLKHGTVYFSESNHAKTALLRRQANIQRLKTGLFSKNNKDILAHWRIFRRIVTGETRLCFNMSVSHKEAKAAELPGALTQLMLKPKLWFCCEEATFHFQHSFVQPESPYPAIDWSHAACNLQASKGFYDTSPMKE